MVESGEWQPILGGLLLILGWGKRREWGGVACQNGGGALLPGRATGEETQSRAALRGPCGGVLPPPPAVFSPLGRAWLPGSEGLVVPMSLPGPGLRNSVLCTSGGLQSPVAKAPIRPLWSLCAPREEAQRKEWALRKPMEGHGLASEELGRCGGSGGQAAQGPKQRPGV